MTAPAPAPQKRLSAGEIAAIVALLQAQSGTRSQLTRTAVAAALAPFRAFTGWWDADQVNRAITEVLKVVQPAQRQAARATDAYLARVASVMTGRTVSPAGQVDITRLRRALSEQVARELVDGDRTPAYVLLGRFDPQTGRIEQADTINEPAVMAIPDPGQANTAGRAEPVRTGNRQRATTRAADLAAALRTRAAQLEASAAQNRAASVQQQNAGSVAAADPYGRIADQYRYQVVAEGVTEERARQRALVRIAAVAATDVTLAVREQYRRSITRLRGVEGYRRIIRPELSESGPCGLCVVAATRLYKKEDLQPIHDLCVCEVLPVLNGMDPGLVLNESDMSALYGEAGTTSGYRKDEFRGLKAIRVALAEHGELGPTLVDADQRFRGPRDVARTRHPDREVRDLAKLAAFEERLAIMLRRQAAGEDVGRAVEWQSERVERLRRELGRRGIDPDQAESQTPVRTRQRSRVST